MKRIHIELVLSSTKRAAFSALFFPQKLVRESDIHSLVLMLKIYHIGNAWEGFMGPVSNATL